jgi:hypothetical protein
MSVTTDANRTAESTGEQLPLFGPPPLYEGEDTALYYKLLSRVSSLVKPRDILEQIWVQDLVDIAWGDIFRLRRLNASLMTANAYKGLREVLAPLVDWAELDDLCKTWAARKPEAIEAVTKLLASAGLTMDAVMAQTWAVMRNENESISHMIATAEARWAAILREIDRHRETLGPKLAVHQLEESQLRVIESGTTIDGTAA